MKSRVQDTYIEIVTKHDFRDIFSYESRTTKRLLRAALRLAAELAQRDCVHNNAAADEVWIVCIVPIMQGYWRSNTAEHKKKEVLRQFHNTIGNIVFNDIYLRQSTDSVQAFNDLFDKSNAEFNEKLKQRISEYLDAIDTYLVRQHVNYET